MLCDAAAASAARHRQQDARPLAVVTLLTYIYWVLTRALVVQALAAAMPGCVGRATRPSLLPPTYTHPTYPYRSLSLSLTRTLALPEAVGGGPGVRALCCQSPRHQYTHP